MRNHGGNSDLRIIEMHPGGGQYYIYQIVRVRGADGGIYDPSSVPVGDFNLLSGTVSGCGINSDTSVPWLREWFENPDPKMAVDIAVQTLDLPVVIHLPSTNRRIFGFRLMSALLGSRITKSDYLFPRMGFADTSGYGGGRLKELSLFSSLSPSLENDKNSDSRAADCWLLYSGWEERLLGAIRMDGMISFAEKPNIHYDLYATYKRNRKMSEVLSEANAILGLE